MTYRRTGNKNGRPPIVEDKKRKGRFCVNLTDAEDEELRKVAADNGIGISVWARAVLLRAAKECPATMSDGLLTRLGELERLRCAATPGDWWVLPDHQYDESLDGERHRRWTDYHIVVGDQDERICTCNDDEGLPKENSDFITEARNTTLLTEARDEIVRLRAEVERLRLERHSLIAQIGEPQRTRNTERT